MILVLVAIALVGLYWFLSSRSAEPIAPKTPKGPITFVGMGSVSGIGGLYAVPSYPPGIAADDLALLQIVLKDDKEENGVTCPAGWRFATYKTVNETVEWYFTRILDGTETGMVHARLDREGLGIAYLGVYRNVNHINFNSNFSGTSFSVRVGQR